MRKPTLKEAAKKLTAPQLKKYFSNVEFMEDPKAKRIFRKVLKKEIETRTKRKIKRTGIILIKREK